MEPSHFFVQNDVKRLNNLSFILIFIGKSWRPRTFQKKDGKDYDLDYHTKNISWMKIYRFIDCHFRLLYLHLLHLVRQINLLGFSRVREIQSLRSSCQESLIWNEVSCQQSYKGQRLSTYLYIIYKDHLTSTVTNYKLSHIYVVDWILSTISLCFICKFSKTDTLLT